MIAVVVGWWFGHQGLSASSGLGPRTSQGRNPEPGESQTRERKQKQEKGRAAAKAAKPIQRRKLTLKEQQEEQRKGISSRLLCGIHVADPSAATIHEICTLHRDIISETGRPPQTLHAFLGIDTMDQMSAAHWIYEGPSEGKPGDSYGAAKWKTAGGWKLTVDEKKLYHVVQNEMSKYKGRVIEESNDDGSGDNSRRPSPVWIVARGGAFLIDTSARTIYDEAFMWPRKPTIDDGSSGGKWLSAFRGGQASSESTKSEAEMEWDWLQSICPQVGKL